MTATRSGRRPRRRLLLLSVLAIVGLALLEGAVRVRQYLRYGTTTSFYAFRTDPASGLRVPAPGVTRGRDNVIEVNSLGFRGPELELPKPPGRVRVAFLGGSTTFCAEASSNDATWPAQVTARLAQRYPHASFDYVNAGAAAFGTVQCLLNLDRRVAPLQPDIVVIYEATNDIAADTRAMAVAQGLLPPGPPAASWLADHSVAYRLIAANIAARSARGDEADAFAFDPVALAASFRGHLAALVTAAQAVAPTVVVVTFAHRARRGMSAEDLAAASATSLMWMPWMTPERVLDAFDACNAVIRDVARQAGVVLVEGEDNIPPTDECFADSVHFRDAGCELQAARVLAALDAAPQLRWLAERDAQGQAAAMPPGGPR